VWGRRTNCGHTGLKSGTRFRASAPICKTISKSMCKWPAGSRSRSTAVMGTWAKARIGLTWLMFRTGLGATNHFEAGGFVRSAPDVAYPTSSCIFCLRPFHTMAGIKQPATVSRSMSDLCARSRAARFDCGRPMR
jgi:hypothetical protein